MSHFRRGPRYTSEGRRMTTSSRKQFALVIGASSGIGYELAKQFAQNGFDLLITAAGDRIHTAADEIQKLGANAEAVEADLATHDGVHKLLSAIQSSGRPVDAAINAGVGVSGRFFETDLAEELRMVALNVRPRSIWQVHRQRHGVLRLRPHPVHRLDCRHDADAV